MHQTTLRNRLPKLSVSGNVTLSLGLASLAVMLFQGATLENSVSVALVSATFVIVGGLVALDIWRDRKYGDAPPRLMALVLLFIHFIAIEVITLWDGLTYTAILYLTLPFPAFFTLGRRAGYVVTASLLVWVTTKFFVFKTDWLSDPTTVNSFALLLISMAFISAMSHTVTNERAARRRAEGLLADLEASHRQLSDYSEQVAELATVAERNRLARDIHDSLGHYLTVIGIQLQKAQVIFKEAPDEALESVGNAARMTDLALKDVRVSVSALRNDAKKFSLRRELQKIATHWRDFSFEVNLKIDGDEEQYEHQQLMALYRAVQEGITNVQRHAQASLACVHVTFAEKSAQLILSDDGIGLPQDHRLLEGGGLRGLRERLERVGGQLSVRSPNGGGTQLTITIPKLKRDHNDSLVDRG